MSELSGDAKALIEQGRVCSEPNPHDKARVRARLVSELGASAFAGVVLASSAASATELGVATAKVAKGVSAIWLKSLIALSAVTGGTVALYVAQPEPVAPREHDAHVRAPMHLERTTHEAPALPPATTQLRPAEVAREPSAAEGKKEFPSARRRAKEAPAHPAKQPSESPATSAKSKTAAEPLASDLSAELALLARAQRELRAGHASEALAFARQHAAEFPGGTLGEERDGIETLARCMLGEANEAHARAFLSRAPSSPLAARVRKECGIK